MDSSLKKVLIPLAAVVLVAIVIAISPSLDTLFQEPMEDQLAVLLDTSSPEAEAVANAVELLKPLETQEVESALDAALEKCADTKDHRLLAFTEVANRLADAGVLGKEAAQAWNKKAAENYNPSQINSPEERAWSISLLKRLDRADADPFMRGYIKTYTRSHKKDMYQFIVQNRTIPELLELTFFPEKDKYYNGSGVFMEDVLVDAEVDLSAVRQYLAEISDPQLRSWLICCATATRTQPDDVLAFLHLAQETGLPAADCYPERIILDWDLTQLDPFTFATEIGAYDKWLPIIMTEQAEPEEFKFVPDELFSTGDVFESVYAEDYEGNDALGKDAFAIRLDMELLAAMPAQAIPETLEELDALLVRSTLYVRDGTLRLTETNKTTGNPITTQVDYPLYAALQTVDLYDMHSMQVAHRFAVNSVSPENRKPSSQPTNDRYIVETNGKPDNDWMKQQKQNLKELLDTSGWDLMVAMVNNSLSALMSTDN